MKEQFLSFLKKRIKFPSFKEIRYVLKIFSLREKIIFAFFAIIFMASISTIIWKASSNVLVDTPATGGTLKEGIVGTPRFINPLLEVSDADRDMVSLIYSGLLRPDNKKGLIPDLAEKYEISEDGLSYTFILKENLEWQDGEPITSDDVIFTIKQAKDNVLNSSKRASWEGVTAEKIDDRTIKFTLIKPYIPFLENTTIGILPIHIWKNAFSEQMVFSEFNISPIGSGPYMISKISRNSSGIVDSYTLEPFKNFALGKPYIKKLVLKFYPSENELVEAYKNGEVDNISAISPQIAEDINKNESIFKTPILPRVFGLFFNQNEAKIFAQSEIREALNLATDKEQIIQEVLKGYGAKLDYPIPPETFGELTESEKEISLFDLEKAKNILKNAGWKTDEETGILKKELSKKEKIEFSFSISTSNVPDLKQTAELLKIMWEKLGAKIDLKIFETGDLKQSVIRPRKYESLLFGEILGREPDPFAFWHSSQRNDPGLNISMYTNINVDKILEEARTISNQDKREQKYKEFQKLIHKDMPAVFLYSPKFVYIVPDFLKMNDIENITVPSERFSQINTWYIQTKKTLKIFSNK